MKWQLHVRPPADVCPEEYCFHWASAGDKVAPPGKRYTSVREALLDSTNWPVERVGRCACQFGSCRRLDPMTGAADYYEPCEPRLERDGLPRFYFSTLDSLRPEFHERFIKEAVALWGETALTEIADPPIPPTDKAGDCRGEEPA